MSAAQARAAAKRLEKLIAQRPSFAEVLHEDKWVGLEELRRILDDKNSDWRNARTWDNKASLRDLIKTRFLSRRQVVESYTRAADAEISIATAPYQPNPATPPPPDNIVNANVNPSLATSRFNDARVQTQLSLLLLRFALRAHRVENGAYPPNLTVLAPRYLSRIPTDPFQQNAPFGYRKSGDSYLLWSVGPDGTNNNGRPIPPRDKRPIASMIPDSVGDAIARP